MSLFKLTATLGLNTSDYEKNVKRAGRSAKTLGGALKNAGQGALATRNRIKQLSAEYAAANTSVAALSAAYNKSVKETGVTSNATRELGEKLKAAQEKAAGLKSELDGLTASSRKTSQKFKEFGKNAAAFTGKVMGGSIKLLARGTAIAAGAVSTLVTQAVKGYSEYEQLVGGVETLFGTGGKGLYEYSLSVGKTVDEVRDEYWSLKDAENEVLSNSATAYKTAGMSANEYMETVTSFSASLIQSLDGDTQAAAQKADMAITDMSDNANKMGSSMETLKTAYAGFAKGQFMLLDNLKLGYGGTKGEMERLLKDAQAISGVKYDISSYADIVDAIHVIQDEMGVTGTTAKEASTTIQGSWGALKASFQNVLTSMAGGGPAVKETMGQMVDSALTFLDNLMPVVETSLGGAITLIQGLIPRLAAMLPTLLQQVLPQLLSTAVLLVTTLLQGLLDNADQIVETAFQLISILAEGLITALPLVFELGPKLVVGFLNKITENPDAVVETGLQILLALIEGIISAFPQIMAAGVSAVAALIEALVERIPDILAAGVELIGKLVEGAESAFDTIVENGKTIVDKYKQGISDAWDGLTRWFNNLWDKLFKNRKVDVEVNKKDNTGSGTKKAGGVSYVPYNGMPAILHRGEAVLTARQADTWRRGDRSPRQGLTIVQNIQTVPQTPVELAAASRAYLEQARWAVTV